MIMSNTQPMVAAPERIAPVAPGIHRPFWSVMIPTYNCAQYLVKTLESVLAQDPGPEQMQIEVVDDVSTKDDPEVVVKDIGKGRVQFYRQPKNIGPTPNFNSCLQRSRGHWVHVLHGDDYVLPGFYSKLAEMIQGHSEIALACSRVFFVDENAAIEGMSPRLGLLEKPTRDVTYMFIRNHLQFAGVALKRGFVEEHGGFHPSLVHTADWEMWIRCISMGTGMIVNEPLAAYRFFSANHTSQLMRTAENLKDRLRLGEILAATQKSFDHVAYRRNVGFMALNQADEFQLLGDSVAAAANLAIWRTNISWIQRTRFRMAKLGRSLINI